MTFPFEVVPKDEPHAGRMSGCGASRTGWRRVHHSPNSVPSVSAALLSMVL